MTQRYIFVLKEKRTATNPNRTRAFVENNAASIVFFYEVEVYSSVLAFRYPWGCRQKLMPELLL